MKTALLVYETPEDFAARDAEDTREAYWARWEAYAGALGVITVGGACLEGPETATTVRVVDGERQVQDGPFADTKEQLGGFFLLETETLGEAAAHAGHAPCARTAGVEARPVADYSDLEG